MQEKRIVFAVGGTGGHLFPAIALARRLQEIDPTIAPFFAGGGVKSPEWLEKQSISYRLVASAPLSGRQPLKLLRNLLKVRKGIQESKELLTQLKPSIVIGFGSFYSLPLLVAARSLKIPYILHEQNTIPGRVIRLFSKKALFTAIHFEGAKRYIKGKSQLVDMPLRWKLSGAKDKKSAKQTFGLPGKYPAVLIFGGSQGAAQINRLMVEEIKKQGGGAIEILHFTGNSTDTRMLTDVYRAASVTACVKDFEERMDLAWQAADLAIARAGALSLAEEIEFEVPGILIPYPSAMDNHQEVNADFFVNEVKGGIKFVESSSKGASLLDNALKMMANGALETYRDNIVRYKMTNRPQEMAIAVLEQLDKTPLLVEN